MFCYVNIILILTESSIRYVGSPERPPHRSRLVFLHLTLRGLKDFSQVRVEKSEKHEHRDEPTIHDFQPSCIRFSQPTRVLINKVFESNFKFFIFIF